MKYIIWGAGQRGKKALSILGKERVLLFIDKDESIQGKKIENIEIYNPCILNKTEENYIILITPLNYSYQIMDELDRMGKKNYLLFADHPYCLDMNENVDTMKPIHNIPHLDGSILIYGITWFTLYLYDVLYNLKKNPILYSYGRNHEIIEEIIKNEYKIISDNNFLKSVDHIVTLNKIEDIPKEKCIDIEEYIERGYPIVNPVISNYKNIHKGERCFIVGTGPSLKVTDLDRIKQNGEICISMNRIYNIFDRTDWRPNYYVIEDEKMIEDLANEIAELRLDNKFVNQYPQKYWQLKESKTSIKFKMIMQNCLDERIGFSLNPDRFLYNGYTVTYVCLQLAVYMGFKDIYLIGIDFNYSNDIYAEANHFEGYQNYYKDIRLNPVKPDNMRRAYEEAKRIACDKNIHIYNATRGGKLEVFERVDLDNVIEQKRC